MLHRPVETTFTELSNVPGGPARISNSWKAEQRFWAAPQPRWAGGLH
jgi:hypothetical protein